MTSAHPDRTPPIFISKLPVYSLYQCASCLQTSDIISELYSHRRENPGCAPYPITGFEREKRTWDIVETPSPAAAAVYWNVLEGRVGNVDSLKLKMAKRETILQVRERTPEEKDGKAKSKEDRYWEEDANWEKINPDDDDEFLTPVDVNTQQPRLANPHEADAASGSNTTPHPPLPPLTPREEREQALYAKLDAMTPEEFVAWKSRRERLIEERDPVPPKPNSRPTPTLRPAPNSREEIWLDGPPPQPRNLAEVPWKRSHIIYGAIMVLVTVGIVLGLVVTLGVNAIRDHKEMENGLGDPPASSPSTQVIPNKYQKRYMVLQAPQGHADRRKKESLKEIAKPNSGRFTWIGRTENSASGDKDVSAKQTNSGKPSKRWFV
ncbi:hypothetical protein EDC01DRAFT_782565 [Geopyxis carbonaria]|nr:hypothetical protein EDC01DRAFT_782565 [Geopyxis carbonaria]